jgi:endonuclease/exonuclease/phosphatase family metal-dependent hydrolase
LLAVSAGASGLLLTGCGRLEVSVLTYNVAGLPEAFSSEDPAANTPRISPLLRQYDLVLVQEDFVYHQALAAETDHEFRMPGGAPGPGGFFEIKSGLSRFSRFDIERYHVERWAQCHGLFDSFRDCMAPKGFSVAEHLIDLGRSTVAIDVYDLHMDAGDGPGDREARAAQIDQLVEFIRERSSLKAVVVAGDTNIEDPGDPLLQRLLSGAELLDACAELDCSEPERIDRIFYRSSRWVEIEPVRWWIPDEFVNEEGEALSDHEPVAVELAIAATPLSEEQVDVLRQLLGDSNVANPLGQPERQPEGQP